MTLKERSELRRRNLQAHVADSFEDAELWDLIFWQNQTPETRLSALVAIRNDIAKVRAGKQKRGKHDGCNPGL